MRSAFLIPLSLFLFLFRSVSISYWMLNYRFEHEGDQQKQWQIKKKRSIAESSLCTFSHCAGSALPSEQNTLLWLSVVTRRGQHSVCNHKRFANNVHCYTLWHCILLRTEKTAELLLDINIHTLKPTQNLTSGDLLYSMQLDCMTLTSRRHIFTLKRCF